MAKQLNLKLTGTRQPAKAGQEHRRRQKPAVPPTPPPDDPLEDDEPVEPEESEPLPDEPSDWEPNDIPCTDDDSSWDVFLPEEEERDPMPDPGDFPGYGTSRLGHTSE